MATVPTSHDFVGGVATTSEANAYIRDPVAFLLRRPRAELRQTSAQTFTTGVLAAVQFNIEDIDDDIDGGSAHDNVTNNTRYTARYAGRYLISGTQSWASNVTGTRQCLWRVNGGDVNGSQVIVNASVASIIQVNARTKTVLLNVGDYVELFASQGSGGNLDSAVTGGQQPHMTVLWVGLT